MKVTSDVYEAFLKCPTKCWLRATAQLSAGNTYAEWAKAQNDAYRTTGIEQLIAEFANNEVARAPAMENVMASKWRLASSFSRSSMLRDIAAQRPTGSSLDEATGSSE